MGIPVGYGGAAISAGRCRRPVFTPRSKLRRERRHSIRRDPEYPANSVKAASNIAPRASATSRSGYHTHPGDEAAFVLKGSLIWKVKGQPDRTLKAGDSFSNPRGSIHSVAAAPDGDGATAVSAWIIDKGQPLATLVP
jgi:quercetin dioxygenase-like cupin family protein